MSPCPGCRVHFHEIVCYFNLIGPYRVDNRISDAHVFKPPRGDTSPLERRDVVVVGRSSQHNGEPLQRSTTPPVEET